MDRARTEYSDPATPAERIAEIEAPDAPDVWGEAVLAMIRTPSKTIGDVRAKFTVLSTLMMEDSIWGDDRLLLESSRKDVLRLLG